MHGITAGVLSYASDNRVTVNVDRWKRNQRNILEIFLQLLIKCSDDELQHQFENSAFRLRIRLPILITS